MSNYIAALNAPGLAASLAGGKGARLAEMAWAGFPVPDGFIITTAACRTFEVENGLVESLEKLQQLAEQAGRAREEALERVAREVRAVYQGAAMPDSLSTELLSAYRALAAPVEGNGHSLSSGSPATRPVAVRSSATAEDLPSASFAGQGATFLNVRGEEAFLAALRDCWASLWSDRAIQYLKGRKTGSGTPAMAVVVQLLVPADAAGIMFTADPVSGNEGVFVINAAWGLGEAIVSGRVSPDTLVIEKTTGKFIRREVGEKAVMSTLGDEGVIDAPVDPGRRSQPVLEGKEVGQLVRLGGAVEAYFGCPQDLEWAIVGERIYLLQARPVTGVKGCGETQEAIPGNLPEGDHWPAVDERSPQPYDLWSQAVLGEVWPGPVTPLMWSGIPTIISGSIRYSLRGLNSPAMQSAQWAGRFYGRVYYNEGALVHLLSGELGLPASFVDAALGSRRGEDRREEDHFRPLRLVSRLPFLVRMGLTQLGTGRQLEDLFGEIDRWVEEFSEEALESLSDRQLWDAFMLWVERFQQAIGLQAEISNTGITVYGLLEGMMARWFGRKELAQRVITGLSGVYAAEMSLDLWRMASAIEGAGLAAVVLENDRRTALSLIRSLPEAEQVNRMLESFLAKHGHRCPNEGEWLYPRWAEAPEQVVEAIAGQLRSRGDVNPEETEARLHRQHEEAMDWIVSHLDPVRRFLFRRVAARAQHGARLRDNGKHYYMKLALPVRRIDLCFGRRWAARGWLEEPEDIFFLTIPDILRVLEVGSPTEAGLDFLSLVPERRKAYEGWFAFDAPAVLDWRGQPIGTVEAISDRSILTGIAASGGTVRGRARIIRDPDRANDLAPGDIIVARAAHPGWTPLFNLVSGLILEVGGQLSHAAIVARECGLPAVVNVPGATTRIQEGQEIFLDGSTGQVRLLERVG